MTKIDLAKYLAELRSFAKLADEFVDRASTLRLDGVIRDLEIRVDKRETPLRWATERDIIIASSTSYDGQSRDMEELNLKFTFEFIFIRDDNAAHRDTNWKISRSATHMQLEKNGYELPIHFDYKNMLPEPQWGPQLHCQISEDLLGIPIPRIISPVFLPSDCLDVLLSELHSEKWMESQMRSVNRHDMSTIRKGQENRIVAYMKEISDIWREDKTTTRIFMLQNFTSSLNLLPSHAG